MIFINIEIPNCCAKYPLKEQIIGGQNKMKNQYWTFKDGTQSDKTKQEQVKGKNPFIIWDYLDLFKKYDIPMIYKEWHYRLLKQYRNNKIYQEMQRIVFGKYLALMKLKGYKDYTFEDSKHFN